MRVRLISSMVGIVILGFVLCFFDTLVLNTAIAIVCVIGIYEFLKSTGYIKNKYMSVLSIIFVAIIPFLPYKLINNVLPILLVSYAILLFTIVLFTHNTTKTEHMSLTFLVSISLSLALSTCIFVRDISGLFYGIFYIMLVLAGAWMSDTGGYFIGGLLGKKKLAPQISPKKTVAGAVGGIVFCVLSFLLLGFVFSFIGSKFKINVTVDYLSLGMIAPIISLISILGDLSASIIKRQHDIKDFGYIMPGHGGILDRFDSVFFVAPVLFIIHFFIPFITIA